MDRDRFARAATELGLNLTDAQLTAFETYEANLYETNEVTNLTRVAREECWTRHFVDSLLFQELISEGASVLDIGTGPGLPAWPLAAARPDIQVTALDSNRKMLGFLRENPLPNLTVVEARAEEWGHREEFDVVTGRALAPLALQLELSAAACKVGGVILPLRTPNDFGAIELFRGQALGIRLEKKVERSLPEVGAERLCPVYRKLYSTPAKYPRPWPEMKRAPIG